MEIIAGELSGLGEILADGGAGGPGGSGGGGMATTETLPGGTEHLGGSGGGVTPDTGDGGAGETGSDGSGNGAAGPTGNTGAAGTLKQFSFAGAPLVQADNSELRVILTGPDTTLIRNEGETDYGRVIVNMMVPPYDNSGASAGQGATQ